LRWNFPLENSFPFCYLSALTNDSAWFRATKP
jgi:hypothetical protein